VASTGTVTTVKHDKAPTELILVIDLGSLRAQVTGRVVSLSVESRNLSVFLAPENISESEAVFLACDDLARSTLTTEDPRSGELVCAPVAWFNPSTSQLAVGPAEDGRVFAASTHIPFDEPVLTAALRGDEVHLPQGVLSLHVSCDARADAARTLAANLAMA
jgi:hypothetical protein